MYSRRQEETSEYRMGFGFTTGDSSSSTAGCATSFDGGDGGGGSGTERKWAAGAASPLASGDASPTAGRAGGGGAAEGLVAEVLRIVRCPSHADYREVLGLLPDDAGDLQAAQSRYRQLMRLLHPDKRREEDETRAGGRDVCDEAIRRVQRALESARGSSTSSATNAQQSAASRTEDPAVQHMRRMQEVQREQARQAMQRHREVASGDGTGGFGAAWRSTEAAPAAAPRPAWPMEPPAGDGLAAAVAGLGAGPSAEDLLKDISLILGEEALGDAAVPRLADPRRRPGAVGEAPPVPNAETTAQLINLLAGLR